jgi:hypothetical protein
VTRRHTTRDPVDLKVAPMEESRKLESAGLRNVFDRRRAELGFRNDCCTLTSNMASLDDR